jgi:hypothetical protein
VFPIFDNPIGDDLNIFSSFLSFSFSFSFFFSSSSFFISSSFFFFSSSSSSSFL